MNALRALAAILTLTLVASISACAPGHGAGVDFWGNPIESDAAAVAACGVMLSAPTVPGTSVTDQLSPDDYQVRPPGVAPGNSWIMIGVHVRAMDAAVPGDGMEYCASIDVHIEVEAIEGDTELDGHPGAPRVYDFEVATPWLNHFVPFDYDPRDPRFTGRPPRYKISVTATYSPDDFPGFAPPALLTCDLTIRTGIVATDHQLPSDGPVRCVLVDNIYDRYDQYANPQAT